MASTGVDFAKTPYDDTAHSSDKEKDYGLNDAGDAERRASIISVKAHYDSTHRKLRPRHIQLIGIGGTIGCAFQGIYEWPSS